MTQIQGNEQIIYSNAVINQQVQPQVIHQQIGKPQVQMFPQGQIHQNVHQSFGQQGFNQQLVNQQVINQQIGQQSVNQSLDQRSATGSSASGGWKFTPIPLPLQGANAPQVAYPVPQQQPVQPHQRSSSQMRVNFGNASVQGPVGQMGQVAPAPFASFQGGFRW